MDVAVDLTAAPVVAGLAALAVVAVLAVWLVPKRQAEKWAQAGISGKELAELENGARTTVVQIVGGIALLLTFAATWTQIADTRNATNRSLRLNESQQETDRFTRAVQQLGSDNFALRLGGIYSLGQLAQVSPEERQPVVQLMLAYLHRNHAVRPGAQERRFGVACVTSHWRPLPDTQAALDVILGMTRRPSRLDLSKLDLRAVDIHGRDLARADLRRSWLGYVDASGARLDQVQLFEADLHGGCFVRASFRAANFVGAHVGGADFSHAIGVPADIVRESKT